MTRFPIASSSSTEVAPGAEVAGFRVERPLGNGSKGTRYDATQLGLDRRVLLRLLPLDDVGLADRFERLEWFEHPHAVSVYAAGTVGGRRFVATQLVPGPNLAERRPRRRDGREILAGVAAALDAAHAAGLAHGDVRAENVLVDGRGRGLLADFGLGPPEATPERDRREFARLVEATLGSPADASRGSAAAMLPPERPRRRWPWLAAPVVLGAVAAIVLSGHDSGGSAQRTPAVAAGVRALGSSLPADGVRSVDCEGERPSGASPVCTLLQTRLAGRPVTAPADGAVRRWVVRGARGRLALQVLRRRGREFDWIVRSPFEDVPDAGVHSFAASLPLRRGDRVAVVVAPGAAVGVRRAGGATTARWLGPLRLAVSTRRQLERGANTGFDDEILVRVDYAPGAPARLRGLTTGAAAARLPAGRRLDAQDVELGGGLSRTLAAVRLPNGIAVDLFAGDRRLARLTVPDMNPRGSVVDLTGFGNPILRLRWRNPDGFVVSHDYGVRRAGLEPRS